MTLREDVLNAIRGYEHSSNEHSSKKVSRQAIRNWILANRKYDMNSFNTNLRKTLKNLVDEGVLEMHKQSFSLKKSLFFPQTVKVKVKLNKEEMSYIARKVLGFNVEIDGFQFRTYRDKPFY